MQGLEKEEVVVENNMQMSMDELMNNNQVSENKDYMMNKLNNILINRDKKVQAKKQVTVLVDAKSGLCEAFDEEFYCNKYARGTDKNDGFYKAYYSNSHISRTTKVFEKKYGIDPKDSKRVDALIYRTLCNYDESVWVAKKSVSHLAEDYVKIMSKNYAKKADETSKEHERRSRSLRRDELLKNNIRIMYDLSGMVLSHNLLISDRINMKKYVKEFGFIATPRQIEKVKQSLELVEEVENVMENHSMETVLAEIKKDKKLKRDQKIQENYNFTLCKTEKRLLYVNNFLFENASQRVSIGGNKVFETKVPYIEIVNKEVLAKRKQKILEKKKKQKAANSVIA